MSKEVKRYEPEYGVMDMAEDGQGGWVPWEDYKALLAERDRMAEALKEIDAADWSSSESATDFAISQGEQT